LSRALVLAAQRKPYAAGTQRQTQQFTISDTTDSAPTRDDVLAIAGQNSRVCPLQHQWNNLYELLPAKRRIGYGLKPRLPLILAAWHDTPAMTKVLRLQEHINWANSHGSLAIVAGFLASLPEVQWLHLDE
jgi:hypothetical protein